MGGVNPPFILEVLMSNAKAIPAEVESTLRLRHILVKMYLDDPCEDNWKALISSAITQGTTVIPYLEEVIQFAKFDEDTPLGDLQANLDQMTHALEYLVKEIRQTNIYPEVINSYINE
jgi:hypothetical protein